MKTVKHEMPAGRTRLPVLILALAGALLPLDGLAEAPAPGGSARNAVAEAEGTREAGALKSAKDRQNYALGMMTAKQMSRQAMELEPEAFMLGLKDGASGANPLLSQGEIAEIALGMHNEMKRKQAEAQVEKRAKNKQEGEAFLADNKARQGVVTLASGLQYRILKAGEGRKPTAEDTVVVHYRGTLVNGTEFGNSFGKDEPSTLALKKAIAGWREALPLMPVGSRWQLFVPHHLAYGKRGAGKIIGPNSALVFEVELLGIKDATATAGAGTRQPEAAKSGAAATKSKPAKAAATSAVAGINVTYKLDPRLTKSLYMGERWVSPPTYTAVQDGKGLTVEARAQALDARGGRVEVNPVWESGDASIVKVSGQGRDVKLTVLQEGRSELKVSADGISKTLALKAVREKDVLRVEITQ